MKQQGLMLEMFARFFLWEAHSANVVQNFYCVLCFFASDFLPAERSKNVINGFSTFSNSFFSITTSLKSPINESIETCLHDKNK